MKIELLLMGKTDSAWIKEGAELYATRLKYYTTLSIKEIPELKKTAGLSTNQVKEREGELILKNIKRVIILFSLMRMESIFHQRNLLRKLKKSQ